MTEVLTWERTVAALREIIGEYGEDFVYQGQSGNQCTYRQRYYDGTYGAPSCIVGHLVAKLYPEVFKKIGSRTGVSNHAPAFALIKSPNRNNDPYRNIPITAETHELAKAIRLLQKKQDNQKTWGVAFREAFEETV